MRDFLQFGALIDIAEQCSLQEALILCSHVVAETQFLSFHSEHTLPLTSLLLGLDGSPPGGGGGGGGGPANG